MGAEEPTGQVGSGISMYVSLPQGGGGKLRIDPDGVQTLIKYLEQAKDKLRKIQDRSRYHVLEEPPGYDLFSPIAMEDIRRTASDHLYANKRAQEVFQEIIDNLRDGLAAYRATESSNAQNFKGDG